MRLCDFNRWLTWCIICDFNNTLSPKGTVTKIFYCKSNSGDMFALIVQVSKCFNLLRSLLFQSRKAKSHCKNEQKEKQKK